MEGQLKETPFSGSSDRAGATTDSFTRKYTVSLILLGVLAAFWMLYESPQVSRLNEILEQDAVLAAYPYPFRVISVRGEVATMSTPRNPDFPAYRALALLYPSLQGAGVDSAIMIEAQSEMARVQSRARQLVLTNADVTRVAWELDEAWLRGQGINPDLL